MNGPYGTNEGDIWSGEDSPVGKLLLEENNCVLIHEMMRNDDTGKVEERIYNVSLDNPRMEMQTLIMRAREGAKKWLEAQASMN